MIKLINEKMTVGELAAQYPQTRKVLEKWGIDYCCGGKHDLKTAAAEKNDKSGMRLMAALNEAIETALQAKLPSRDWTTGNADRTGRPHRGKAPYVYERAIAAAFEDACQSKKSTRRKTWPDADGTGRCVIFRCARKSNRT